MIDRNDLLRLICEEGEGSALSFFKSRPSSTLGEIAEDLADGIAPIQLEAILREECVNQGQVQYLGRTLLVRNIRKFFPNGWGSGSDFQRAKLFAFWLVAMRKVQGVSEDQLQEIVRRLKGKEIESDWIPSSEVDPLIEEVFRGLLESC